MGKVKKGHNWKARQNEVEYQKQTQVKVEVDIDVQEDKYDESNVFALPSEKQKAKKIKNSTVPKQKPLSKKEKKRLKQVKQRKAIGQTRKQLYEDLLKVQATSKELSEMTSVSEAQTMGVKRLTSNGTKSSKVTDIKVTKNMPASSIARRKINSIKGSNKLHAKKNKDKSSAHIRETSSSASSDSDEEVNELPPSTNKANILSGEKFSDPNTVISHDVLQGAVNSNMQAEPVQNGNMTVQHKEEAEMDVDLDVCQDKCDETSTKVHSSKKKIKNIKSESIAQANLSKQEEKTEKQFKQKLTKWEKRKQFNDNLEESQFVKEESDITTSVLEGSQLNSMLEENREESVSKKESDVMTSLSEDQDTKRLKSIVQTPKMPAKHVPVLRTEEIEKARSALPILSEEHTIMDAIHKNPVVIIYGQTGCGKTTQIPQFLYEAGYASGKSRIGITEPRRLAAITMSQRVAHEMSLPCNEVSYKIRYEGNVTPQTKIKFMTDGVLLKEIKDDFYMTKYQAIIIDEAHERTMQSDVLIGLLSRVVKLHEKRGKPLKLIIMSATLRLEDFVKNKRLFDPSPPVVTIDARQHPVTTLYNRHTVEDYIGEAYRKVCKIHQTNQYGGILVFVTGQEEVNALCRKLKRAFPLHKARKNLKTEQKTNESNQEAEEEEQLESTLKRFKRSRRKARFEDLPNINLDDYCAEIEDEDKERLSEGSDISYGEDKNEEMLSEGNDDYIDSEDDELHVNSAMTTAPLYVLPLYSVLPADQQAKVFQPPPAGRRLCVISTNVAETSLTVPNVKYVVDTGKVKRRMYDKVTGVSTFVITWISKASAKQRAGRAGRTSAGYCYRLYSSAVYENDFPDFFEPEIIQRPVDDIVLQLKFMRIDRVVDFPFPRSPDVESIKAAEERLVLLGALEKHHSSLKKCEWASTITPFGQTMACISVSPRYSKMIALSNQRGVMPYTIATVAALTVQEIFIDDHGTADADEQMEQMSKNQKLWKTLRLSWAAEGQSRGLGDVMTLLEAVGLVENRGCTPSVCHSLGIRYKAMMEIRKLRKQLTNEVNSLERELNLCVDPNMKAPTDLQKKFLRQILLSGMADHVARKLPKCAIKDEDKKKLKNAYECIEIEEPVFIHPSSVLFKQLPEFVMYQEIIETSKHYMKIVSAVEQSWLSVIGQKYCTLSDPLDDPPPRYNNKKDEILCHMGATYGWRKWPIEPVELKYPRNDQTSITWFARFFLEGEVCTSLKAYSMKLLSKPSIIDKQWARVLPRAKNLLNAFITHRIDSKKLLQEIWSKDPKYLLKEYCEWLPESFLYEVSEKWPPT